MIKFKDNDYHIPVIRKASGLDNITTRNYYRVFGLKDKGNAPILVVYNPDMFSYDTTEVLLREFFKNNKIDAEFRVDQKSNLWIGLRKDVRKNTKLAVSILKTIIYYMEGRLKIRPTSKIPNVQPLTINH